MHQTITIRFNQSDMEKLQFLAETEGKNRSAIIRRAITYYESYKRKGEIANNIKDDTLIGAAREVAQAREFGVGAPWFIKHPIIQDLKSGGFQVTHEDGKITHIQSLQELMDFVYSVVFIHKPKNKTEE